VRQPGSEGPVEILIIFVPKGCYAFWRFLKRVKGGVAGILPFCAWAVHETIRGSTTLALKIKVEMADTSIAMIYLCNTLLISSKENQCHPELRCEE
jgi:hypothetical protein